MPRERKRQARKKPLVGSRVYLRPFERKDLAHVQRWYKDPEIRMMVGEAKPMSRQDAEKWYRVMSADKDRRWFVIVLKEGDRVIGEAGLLRMFKPWLCTDMTIIIGEKDAWGKGYGTEAGHLVLDLAFKKFGFHRVAIGAVGLNDRALRFWRGLGFKDEGLQRDGYYCDGEYSDFVMMSLLEDEYKARK